ncbi:MAG TPA: hypothetical protein VGR71_16225, partial [Nitrospira sp.]|nr:hypothetical protein [Nitrospira sp.]
TVRAGTAGHGRHGLVSSGTAWLGLAWQARRGTVGSGGIRSCPARQASLGVVSRGKVRDSLTGVPYPFPDQATLVRTAVPDHGDDVPDRSFDTTVHTPAGLLSSTALTVVGRADAAAAATWNFAPLLTFADGALSETVTVRFDIDGATEAASVDVYATVQVIVSPGL